MNFGSVLWNDHVTRQFPSRIIALSATILTFYHVVLLSRGVVAKSTRDRQMGTWEDHHTCLTRTRESPPRVHLASCNNTYLLQRCFDKQHVFMRRPRQSVTSHLEKCNSTYILLGVQCCISDGEVKPRKHVRRPCRATLQIILYTDVQQYTYVLP